MYGCPIIFKIYRTLNQFMFTHMYLFCLWQPLSLFNTFDGSNFIKTYLRVSTGAESVRTKVADAHKTKIALKTMSNILTSKSEKLFNHFSNKNLNFDPTES